MCLKLFPNELCNGLANLHYTHFRRKLYEFYLSKDISFKLTMCNKYIILNKCISVDISVKGATCATISKCRHYMLLREKYLKR